MKKINFIILAASLIGLTACGGGYEDGKKTSWSDAEKALLQTYAYGEDVPFVYFEGNEEMDYDEEYGCLTVTGGQATAQQLADYATVLDSYGYEGGYVEDGLYYDFLTEVATNDGARYVELMFYCLDEAEEMAASGTFCLDICDPYYYVWADMPLSDITATFAVPSSAAVPAPVGASHFNLITSYYLFGLDVLIIDAYGVDAATCEASYKTVLETASWTVEFVEDAENGDFYNAVAPSEDLTIQFFYDSTFEALEIYIVGLEPEVDGEENVLFPSAQMAAYINDVLAITDVTVPSLSDSLGAIFSYIEYVDDPDNGTSFYVYAVDNGTVGSNSLEDVYKGLLEGASWVNTNDAEYTYADYGYFYSDPSSKIEVQFYTYEGYFQLWVYAAQVA
ncbi:MAG TPA: hypothetical protein PKO28_01960 [Bacilli bacterium]|nr:hypothetical protein [Bacilli bacterium]HPS19242.1 hypothetical protein [Bacilli bacterium]